MKKLMGVAGAALLALGLTACGGGESGGGSASGGEEIVLEFWHGHTGPDGKVMDDLIQQYEASHEGVKINVQQLSWGELFTKAQLAGNSGSGPDMVTTPVDRLPIYKDTLFQQLASAENDPEIDPALQEAGHVDGQQYALPIDVNLYTLYYRPDLLEAAGLDPLPKDRPLTRKEFEEAATALTDDDTKGFAFKQVAQHSWWDLYSPFLQAGASLYDDAQEQATFDSPETREAIEYMLSLRDDLGVTPENDLDWATAFSLFNSGDVAMLLHGSWLVPGLEESGTPWETAMVPNFMDGEYHAFANAHALALTTEDERRADAVMDFFAWMQEEEQQLAWGQGSGNVPAHLGARATYAQDPKLAPLAHTADEGTSILFMAPYTESDETIIYRDIIPNLEGIYSGTISVDDAVKAIDAAIAQHLG